MSLFAGLPHVALAQTVGPPRKLALLVGISNYEHGGPLDWVNLSCATDLATWKNLLITRFGFAPADIVTLTDAKATRAGIIEAFQKHLIAPARPGDTLVFEYSGHGQSVADDNGDELDGLDESLVPFDYISQSARDGAKTNLRDDELGALIQQARQKLMTPNGQVEGNISVFLDSCHSGSATRGQTPNGRLRVRGRGWNSAIDGPKPVSKVAKTRGGTDGPNKSEGASGILASKDGQEQGVIIVSACDSDQAAQEAENDQGQDMGALTYYLTRALAHATPGATYRDVFERTNAEMMGALSDQNPQLEGDINKALFAGATLPAPAYLVVADVGKENFGLPIGSLQGITKGSRFALYGAGSDISDATNRFAEAEIISVDATASRARLLPEYNAVKPETLQAARAVETARNYGTDRLKVWSDDPKVRDMVAPIAVATTEDVTAANYDVQIRTDGDSLIVERQNGQTLAKIAAANAGRALNEVLLGQWRWRFLTRLGNDATAATTKIQMRLVPVNVQTDETGRVTKVTGDRTDLVPTEGNQTVFHEGDCVMIEFRNPTDFDEYVSTLDLSADGSINPVFPYPDAPGALDNKIPADGNWHRIVGTPESPFVLRLGAPFGNELFKVIATREKADFSPLISAPAAPQRGENALQNLNPALNPLGQLLLAGATGARRGANFAGVPPSNWATRDVPFAVKAR